MNGRLPLWLLLRWWRFRAWLHTPPHIVQFADGDFGLKRCFFGPKFRDLSTSDWQSTPERWCRTADEELIKRVAEDPWNTGIEVSFYIRSMPSPRTPTPRPLARLIDKQ